VFAYLADPRHLREWAHGFAEQVIEGLSHGMARND
jgi:hypothetical protein